MEMDMKKMFYIGVAIVAVAVITISVATPTMKKIQEQKSGIEGISFTAPTGS